MPAKPSKKRASRSISLDMVIGAERFLPAKRASLMAHARAAQACRGCPLYKNATQAVFGEGPPAASVMLVGEQPGDNEDVKGHVFVGPAGAILQKAIAEAGMQAPYITNAVKHFKWTPSPRGKRRIHARPTTGEIKACRPWLERELEIIKPRVLVLMGATAAHSLLGTSFKVTRNRGTVLVGLEWSPKVVVTVHPSSILRAPSDVDRREQYKLFVADLRIAAIAALER